MWDRMSADCVTTGESGRPCSVTFGVRELTWVNQHDGGPHEANFLKLDCSKLKKTFGWKPHWHIQDAIEKTVVWSKAYLAGEDMRQVMDQQIEAY